MKFHMVLIMVMVLGIAAAPAVLATGAARAGTDARIVFYVA